ncbi:hypothetical protein DUNSADRAFT_6734 [Dunaliella salina]|nr:hypothetical protein DUNSADRAFT_6734 [Dunaliella salina]|eukprot:KAF5842490.1 hypothetical protein DUNSADRAFT_6734 [Dunaliella salina]
MGVNSEEPVPVPSWHYIEDPDEEGAAGGPQGTTMPLREALRKCYDLRVPKAELFHALWAALPESARQRAQGSDQGGDRLEQQASSGDEGAQAAVLAQLLAGGAEALDAYFDYTGRHVSDVLRTFPSARISLSQLLGALRALQPRLYSISSSPLEGAGHVQATIAEVRYEAFGKPRAGVASAHVSSCLKPGDRVRVYIHKNPDFRLPQDPSTPIIMVGPGTGLAPFRAFILHRLLGGAADDSSTDGSDSHISGSNASAALSSNSNGSSSANGSTANGIPGSGSHTDGAVANGHVRPSVNSSPANGSSSGNGFARVAVNGSRDHGGANGQNNGQSRGVGQMVLFFGCRRRDQDYLYGRDLDAWAASGAITLFNAFSREQVEKELLAMFAAHLAAKGTAPAATTTPSKKAAKKKSAAAAKQAGEGACLDGAAAAQQYLEKLSTSGRYQRDVWYT